LAIIDIAFVALGEAEQEHRKIPGSKSDHHAIPAASPLPFPGNALLDEAATQISIHQPALGALNRLDQAFDRDPFPASETVINLHGEKDALELIGSRFRRAAKKTRPTLQ
jgi:hypothetical protein